MRLIDADTACRYLRKARMEDDLRLMEEIFNEIPTAYDVDKVIEQLEKMESDANESSIVEYAINGITFDLEYLNGKEMAYIDALEIVKEGGI